MNKIIFFICLLFPFVSESQINIFSDFENGNVQIISINDSLNTIIFEPSLISDNNTTRCWFYFGISDFDTSRVLNIEEKYSSYFTAPNTPVYSFDNKNWHRLHVDSLFGQKKYYSGKFDTDTLWFATGYPYSYSKVVDFVDSIAKNKFVDTSTLCRSEAGLKIPFIEIKDSNYTQKSMIWIIGRQHAFETTLNYVLEGMIKYFVSDNKYAKRFRKKNIIFLVPMMDVDNVYKGASGRMQKPVDFNRDWNNSPYWNAIKAVQKKIKATSKIYKYRIFLDVHSTYPGTTKPLFGLFNEYSDNQLSYRKIKKFFKIFHKKAGFQLKEIRGNTSNFYADAYNMGIVNDSAAVSDFASTLECDWNINNNGKELTISELKKTGYLIAKSICVYLNRGIFHN